MIYFSGLRYPLKFIDKIFECLCRSWQHE